MAPSVEAALRDSLWTQFGARGIIKVSENADLHVVWHVSTKQKVTAHQSPGTSIEVSYPIVDDLDLYEFKTQLRVGYFF